MSQILIPNLAHLEDMIEKIIHAGKEDFHVIADFDRTLTKAFVGGKPMSSLESLLEAGWYLGEKYTLQSKENFDKYYPIEIDPNVPLEEKKTAMLEWRNEQFSNMLKAGLTRDTIKKTIASSANNFRTWYEDFFDTLHKHHIPLLIFSATGLWFEAICKRNERFSTRGKIACDFEIIS